MQKYLHDLKAWLLIPTPAQEQIIGCTKIDNVEIDDDAPRKSRKSLATIIYDQENGHDILHYSGRAAPCCAPFCPPIFRALDDPDLTNWSMLSAIFSGILNLAEEECHEAEAVFGRADSLFLGAG